jgi:uncharacterized RDD family membrane protein YckC
LCAFVARGGLSYRAAALAVVRRDNRRAGRWQCLVRALVVWAPFAVLMLLSFRVDDYFWDHWTPEGAPEELAVLARCLWWGAWLLLAVYAALALLFPRRGLHDYLAGTYVVPR